MDKVVHLVIRTTCSGPMTENTPRFALLTLNEDLLNYYEDVLEVCEDYSLHSAVAEEPADKWDKEDSFVYEGEYLYIYAEGTFAYEIVLEDNVRVQTQPINYEFLKETILTGEITDVAFEWVNGVLFYSEDTSDLPSLIEDFKASLPK